MKPWYKLKLETQKRVEENEVNASFTFQTGMELWDRHGGLKSGEIHLLVGNRASGCTSLALQVALHNIEMGIPVLFISSHLSPELFMYRIMTQRAKGEMPSFHELTQDAFYWDSMCCKYTEDLNDKPFYYHRYESGKGRQALEGYAKFKEKFAKGLIIIDCLEAAEWETKTLDIFLAALKEDIHQSERTVLLVSNSVVEKVDLAYTHFPNLLCLPLWNQLQSVVSRVFLLRKEMPNWQNPDFFRPDFLTLGEIAITHDGRVNDVAARVYFHHQHHTFYNESHSIVRNSYGDPSDDEHPF